MNVDCQNSENFYGLNDQIGNAMGTFSNNDLISSAKEIMGFPGSRQPGSNGNNNGPNGKNPSGLPIKPNSQSGGVSNGNEASRGSSNLGQPTNAASRFPPSAGSVTSANEPNRGANGGTVYVNSLGQLSTDDNAGFDPKESFLLKPDTDSNFDLDIRGPGLDPIKGIGNSYSFGFPQDGSVPIRGSADLSEPVDPSELYNNNNINNNKEPYLPPLEDGQRKQIYTYPHDIQSQLSNGAAPILPEVTGQINTKLAAQSPKYPSSQVYFPVATQPSSHSANTHNHAHGGSSQQQSSVPQRPAQQSQSPQKHYQQPSGASNFQSNGQLSSQPQPSRQYLQPNSQNSESEKFQRPGQSADNQHSSFKQQPASNQLNSRVPTSGAPQNGQNRQTSPQQFQRPGQSSHNSHSGSNQLPRQFSQPSDTRQFQPAQQQPQRFQSQSQRSQQRFQQQPQAQPSQSQRSQQGFQQQPQAQPFRPTNQQAERRQFSTGQHSQESNESFLRKLLENKVHIHDDKNQLVDLIQRIFVPEAGQRVISAEVFPSPARETYSFTYNEDAAASNNHNSIRHANQQPANNHQSNFHHHSANPVSGHPGY